MTPKTMFEKIWDAHIVHEIPGETTILYIDTHLVHEITSAQAFEGLRLTGRKVRRPDLTFATMDHNVPTTDRTLPILDEIAAKQMEVLAQNCAETGITLYDLHSSNQGIVHVIGPELGITQPGRQSFAATATPQHMERWVHLLSVLGPVKWNMSWRLNASCSSVRRPSRLRLMGNWDVALRQRTLFWGLSVGLGSLAERAL